MPEPRRSRDEHHAVRIRYRFHQIFFRARLDAERRQIEGEVSLVENSKNDLFAEQRGQRRHAVVDNLVAHLQLDAAVLRDATLGDVELRHDLEARDQRRLELHRRLHHFLQRAVDTIANSDLVLEAFEVNVRSPATNRIGKNRIDQLHDRRVFHLRRERRLRNFFLRLFDNFDVGFGLEIVDRVHQRRHLIGLKLAPNILSIRLRSVYSPAITGKMS